MPPFQYDTRPNPLLGSIGELIERQGQIATSGVIGAGTAWANAGQQIGQQVSAPLMRVAERMADPAVQLQGEQLKAAQRENRSRNIFEAELRNPSNYKDDGSIDDAKITDRLKKQDVGAWQSWSTISAANAKNAIDLRAKVADIGKTEAETAVKQNDLRTAQTNYLGTLAYHVEQTLKTNAQDPLHARETFMAGIARAVADGGLPAERGRAVLQQTLGASPEQLQQVIGSLVPDDLRGKLEKETADTRKSTAEAAEAQARADIMAKTGALPAAPTASQAKSYRVKGVGDVPLEFVPGRTAAQPGAYFLNKPDGTRQQVYPGKDFVDIPPASVQVNAAAGTALSKMPGWALDASRPIGAEGNVLDPDLRMTPNGLFQDAQTFITSGQYPPTGRGNDVPAQMKRAAIDSKVGAIAAAAGMDVPTLRAFYRANAGSLQQQQKALDAVTGFMATADRNVEQLEKVLPKLPDLGSPIFNKPLRAFERDVAGNADMSEVSTYLRSVKNEYARIVSQPNLAGQLTDSARHEADDLLADTATVGQMLRSIKALKTEGANRVLSMGEQIARTAARIQQPGGPSDGSTPPPAVGAAPAAPAGWKYVPKAGGGWTAVRAQ